MDQLLGFFGKKEASRKYVDLIKMTTSKWANWDPPLRIEAGDFGRINYYSGQFEREGNIYTHEKTIDIATRFQPVKPHMEKQFVASSMNSRKGAFDVSAHADVPGLAGAAFASEYHFDKSRGALLIMHEARMSVVPDEFLNATVSNKFLQGKMLVTQAISCHAFALYLSNKNAEKVKIALKGDIPIHPGASAGADVGLKWWTDGASGLFREGAKDKESFTPLYLIKKIQPPPPGRRGKVDPNAPTGDRWREVDVPWGDLEDDGEEEITE